jgi:hypothetical protein
MYLAIYARVSLEMRVDTRSHVHVMCPLSSPQLRYMPCPSTSPWLDHSHYTWRSAPHYAVCSNLLSLHPSLVHIFSCDFFTLIIFIACLQSVKLQFPSPTYDLLPLATLFSTASVVTSRCLLLLIYISLQLSRSTTRLRRQAALRKEFSLPSQKTPVVTPGTRLRGQNL